MTYLSPFVLTVPATTPETERHRHDRVDLYLPGPHSPQPRLAVVFVHGGPVPAVADARDLPIVLTRVGRETPPIAATVAAFVAAAQARKARLDIIDVPNGQHGFDLYDHTDESRRAVETALDTVTTLLGR